MIPDSHPENHTSIEELQKDIDHIKDLLKNNKNLTEDERKKIEKLQNFYIQQKNIIIENESKKAKDELISKMNVNMNDLLIEEKNRRAEAKMKGEENIQKKINKKNEEESKNKKKNNSNKSIIIRKTTKRIFYNQKEPEKDEDFKDEKFPAEKKSILPPDFEDLEGNDDSDDDDNEYFEGWEEYDWCNINEIIEGDEYTIFEDGATVNDIVQGDINDCYFLSALGSLCSYENYFDKLFYTQNISENHFYGIYLFINGKWKLVLLDNNFPCKIVNYYDKDFCFGKSIQKELWEILLKAFEKEYVLTAGTKSLKIEKFTENNLETGHDYTLINIYTVGDNIKLVKLKNPFGCSEYNGDWEDSDDKWTPEIKAQCEFNEENNEGIFYMPYKDFMEYFDVIHIAKINQDYESTYFKITKDQAIKCQIIELIIEEENPNTFIQLYQKNPRIIRSDKSYYPGNINSFIMLVDSEYKYIKSASGKDTHIAIEVDLKPGKYYIFCDVNYRNEYKSYQNSSYKITFYSKNQIKNFKNVTDRINVISALELSLFYYCKMNIKETVNENGIIVYDSKIANKEIPFRVYCFVNITNKSVKVRLDIKEKDINKFCIYNDNVASEFDYFVIKEVEAMNMATILVLDYFPKSQYDIEKLKDEKIEPDYKFVNDNEIYENEHLIFNHQGEKLDKKGNLLIYYSQTYMNKGYTIGLENISDKSFRLNLKLKEVYDIDGDFSMKDNIEFIILPKSKKIFNLRIKPEAKEPSFEFEEIK